jgi:hypothetical protein
MTNTTSNKTPLPLNLFDVYGLATPPDGPFTKEFGNLFAELPRFKEIPPNSFLFGVGIKPTMLCEMVQTFGVEGAYLQQKTQCKLIYSDGTYKKISTSNILETLIKKNPNYFLVVSSNLDSYELARNYTFTWSSQWRGQTTLP